MVEFKIYVFIGILIAIIGVFIGGLLGASATFWDKIYIIYLSSSFAGVVILWGFADVFDEINDNTKRTTELLEFLTDKLDEGETGNKAPIGPGSTMSNVEIKSLIIRYAHETGDVDELAQMLIEMYPGLTKERIQECVAEIEQEEGSKNFKK